jgi:hypothetical protein
MLVTLISAVALAGSLAVCFALSPVIWRSVRFEPSTRVRDLLIVAAAFGWINALSQSSIRTYRLVAYGDWWLDRLWYAVLPDVINIAAALLVLTAFALAVRWQPPNS